MKKKSLQQKLQDKLSAGKFRILNEMMYLNKGYNMEEYNKLYSFQIKKWSYHPLDKIMSMIDSDAFIIDLGCGDATLSKHFKHVINIDKFSKVKNVIQSSSSQLPFNNNIFDVAVFSLSLMFINNTDSILEAYRVLNYNGILIIGEIISRIESIDNFVKCVESTGFKMIDSLVDKWYFIGQFKRINQCKEIMPVILKPCVYKKR